MLLWLPSRSRNQAIHRDLCVTGGRDERDGRATPFHPSPGCGKSNLQDTVRRHASVGLSLALPVRGIKRRATQGSNTLEHGPPGIRSDVDSGRLSTACIVTTKKKGRPSPSPPPSTSLQHSTPDWTSSHIAHHAGPTTTRADALPRADRGHAAPARHRRRKGRHDGARVHQPPPPTGHGAADEDAAATHATAADAAGATTRRTPTPAPAGPATAHRPRTPESPRPRPGHLSPRPGPQAAHLHPQWRAQRHVQG